MLVLSDVLNCKPLFWLAETCLARFSIECAGLDVHRSECESAKVQICKGDATWESITERGASSETLTVFCPITNINTSNA
jgi:hypothetical protein